MHSPSRALSTNWRAKPGAVRWSSALRCWGNSRGNAPCWIAQLQSGAVTGLINTLRSKITVKEGRIEQSNFDSFPIPRMPEVPRIEIVLMPNGDAPGGIGEAGVPLVAPAIANAVFALTGQRIRGLPLEDAGIRFS